MTDNPAHDRIAQKEASAAAFLARLDAAPASGALDGTWPLDRQALAALALERARLGALWLAGIVQPDGAFPYIYHPETDTYDIVRYNEVRHAGTTYSLFQA